MSWHNDTVRSSKPWYLQNVRMTDTFVCMTVGVDVICCSCHFPKSLPIDPGKLFQERPLQGRKNKTRSRWEQHNGYNWPLPAVIRTMGPSRQNTHTAGASLRDRRRKTSPSELSSSQLRPWLICLFFLVSVGGKTRRKR